MATPTSDLIMETPTPIEVVAKKRRLSGDLIALGVTKNQARYEQATLGGGSGMSCLLTGGKASIEPQQAYPSIKNRNKTPMNAMNAARAEYLAWKKSSSLEVCSRTGGSLKSRGTGTMKVRAIRSARARRRGASMRCSLGLALISP